MASNFFSFNTSEQHNLDNNKSNRTVRDHSNSMAINYGQIASHRDLSSPITIMTKNVLDKCILSCLILKLANTTPNEASKTKQYPRLSGKHAICNLWQLSPQETRCCLSLSYNYNQTRWDTAANLMFIFCSLQFIIRFVCLFFMVTQLQYWHLNNYPLNCCKMHSYLNENHRDGFFDIVKTQVSIAVYQIPHSNEM